MVTMNKNIKSLSHIVLNRVKYFCDNSNLHGVKYTFSRSQFCLGNIIKRFIWLSFICLSALGMMYILRQGSKLFEDKSISFVPETTYLHWTTDYPAITICEVADNDKLKDYYEENAVSLKLSSFHKEIIFLDKKRYCLSCLTCDVDGCPDDFQSIIKTYRSPCNETLIRCSWKGETFQCCERFIPIDTEYGECFVFNSALLDDKRVHLSNRMTGPGYLKFTAMESVTIDIHDPYDVIFRNFDKKLVNDMELPFPSEFQLHFSVEETINDDEVRQVASHVRGCLFPNEQHFQGAKMYSGYSFSTCVVQCRALKQLAICNCTHHLLPRMGNEPACNISGLVCLTNLAGEILEEDDESPCGCLPSCDERKYENIFLKKTVNDDALTDELIDRGTLFSIYMECLPTTRTRRQLVRSQLDYVGGTAGVFFGASILSFIEIIYLIFLRN